jgi:plastocyanin
MSMFVTSVVAPMAARAQVWRVQVGAQSQDKGSQVLAFLPNEIWMHAGDSITWTIASDEPHTVSLLAPGQLRPPFAVGCPGITPDGSDENGSSCVNSGLLANGQSYSISFPKPGNYKLVCLIHANMTAVVHVLDLSEALSHSQNFYDTEAADEQNELLSAVG